MTKKIPLKNGEFTIVDDEDFEELIKFKWYKNGHYVVRAESNGYVDGKQKVSHFYLHREIMNAPKGVQVDHINRNKLDNRRHNLRLCNRNENARNIGPKNVKFKGVRWDGGKWRAYIKTGGVHTCLGRYTNIEDAARAYNAESLKRYGEFAYINPL